MKSILLKFILLVSFTGFSVVSFADKVFLLPNDHDAMQARIDLIQQAKSEIVAEYFSVWNDDQSIGGLALLIEAAQRGVQVKIIVDSLANTIPRSLFATLLEKGKDATGKQTLEVLVYNPISINLFAATHRDHAKMLVVDGRRIITGGRNIGDKYFGLNSKKNFNDLDIMAEGVVAQQARENFYKVWNSKQVKKVALYEFDPDKLDTWACRHVDDVAGCEIRQDSAKKEIEKQHARLKKMLLTIQSKEHVQTEQPAFYTNKDWFENVEDTVTADFVSQNPERFNGPENNSLTERLAEVLENTQEEANIISPYLIPTPKLYLILQKILARGVKVKIITNSLNSTDNVFAQAGYRAHKKNLIDMGVEIYEYTGPNTVHAKTAVIDHRIAIVGTYNIDPRSAFLNREVAMFTIDSTGKLPQELTEVIEDFRSRSFLVGKDKVEYNKEREFDGVSSSKKAALKAVKLILPLIEGQL